MSCATIVAALALAAGAAPAVAQSPAAGTQGAGAAPPLTLVGMRSFSGPENTRVVFELSRPTAFVAPDSGDSRQLMVAIPGEAVARASGVSTSLVVRDGVLDSVQVETRVDGGSFRLWFRDSTRFHVLSLAAQDDQPFRLVVDVERRGAALAVARRLEGIAQGKGRDRVRVVAVDAGHGGEDTGAKGPRSVRVLEKNVTLAVARALVDELNRIPGVRGELTRDGDYFLSQRGASAQADADLADLENAADLVGGVPPQAEGDLVNILYDVKRASALEQSQLLAETLLDHVAADRRLESRGIKQAGFVVLKSVEFPSVLVETAFINNAVEARLLRSQPFQQQMAHQLAEGVRRYFERSGVDLGAANPGGTRPSGP
jgi:N-acetylmuramoyl-L-alanine amidase